MPSTAIRALPYPAGADVPDVPADMRRLADALDLDVHVIETLPRPAAGTLARAHHDPGTGVWSIDTGSAWATLATGGPFLALTGGALSGALDLGGHELSGAIVTERRDKVTTVGAAGAARTLDAAVSPLHDVTLDQNVTFTFSGVDGDTLVLILRQPAAVKTVAWPATVDWDLGFIPTQRASSTVTYRFIRAAGRWIGTFSSTTTDLFVRKTADETVTASSVLQNDDHLFLPVVASSVYILDLLLLTGPHAGAINVKTEFTGPAGAVAMVGKINDSANSPIVVDMLTTIENVDTHPSDIEPNLIKGLLRTGANAGTLQLQWAQMASNAGGNTLKADSYLSLRKVA